MRTRTSRQTPHGANPEILEMIALKDCACQRDLDEVAVRTCINVVRPCLNQEYVFLQTVARQGLDLEAP